jgi:hypothetical protein
LRRELPLATLERELRAAARGKKVKVLGVKAGRDNSKTPLLAKNARNGPQI